eukprot:4157698-Pleurochrysis_carterae.AAC.4
MRLRARRGVDAVWRSVGVRSWRIVCWSCGIAAYSCVAVAARCEKRSCCLCVDRVGGCIFRTGEACGKGVGYGHVQVGRIGRMCRRMPTAFRA